MLFPVVIHHENDSAYGVTVPDIPGCFSAGDSLKEALENVREAIDLNLESLVEDGEALPEASELDALAHDEEHEGGIWYLVDVDITKYMGGVDRLNITLPHLLVTKIDKVVSESKDYRSRSQFLVEASLKMLAHQ
jgi:predicted RNase H-like HicB family nuclease